VQSPKSKRVLKLLEMQLKQLKMALDLKTLVGMNCLTIKKHYNITSRAAQSNSVYISVLKIPIVHADSVSNSVSNIVVRFSRRF